MGEMDVQWGKVIDHSRCIGCHACTTACKSENDVPVGVNRTYVKYVDVGQFPATRRAFQVTRCNQCENAPCVTACPTSAMYKRRDGIVDFKKDICIGCKACIAACPYDAIFINPEDHSAEKCNFCAHRLDVGLEPACVIVCPTEAIFVGDMNDPTSRVAQTVGRDVVSVRRPEKETHPKLFYKGAHQATLDPLAASRPEGGLFLWGEQGNLPDQVVSGHPGSANNSAAAILAYDVPHRTPWNWHVSLYTWTKAIAAGAYLVCALLVVFGGVDPRSALWTWAAPLTGLVFLLVTTGLLIGDLEHPERFYLIFTRPQWKSWLVRGGVILTGFGAVLSLHILATLMRPNGVPDALLIIGVFFAILAAMYTAWLFAQAKARDLWQNPLLPLHHLVQALMVGAAALRLIAEGVDSQAISSLTMTLTFTTLLHLFLVVLEITTAHPTAHARLAVHEMTRGRYRTAFLSSLILCGAGALVAAPLGVVAAVLVLAGLLAYEHAHVQAGQSVPLA